MSYEFIIFGQETIRFKCFIKILLMITTTPFKVKGLLCFNHQNNKPIN